MVSKRRDVLYSPSGDRLYDITVGGRNYRRVTAEEWKDCQDIPILEVARRKQFIDDCSRKNCPNPALERFWYKQEYWFHYLDRYGVLHQEEKHILTRHNVELLIRSKEREGCQGLSVDDKDYVIYENKKYLQ